MKESKIEIQERKERNGIRRGQRKQDRRYRKQMWAKLATVPKIYDFEIVTTTIHAPLRPLVGNWTVIDDGKY